VESDRGGFQPQGIGVGGGESVLKKVQSWENYFQLLGLCWIRPGGGGVDIAPLGEQGTVLMSLVPNSQSYFNFHHCSLDVLDAVDPRELELGALAMAVLAWMMALEGL
jgi:hypothetical protein